MNIVIKNNNIKIKGTDPYASYERSGVFVSGYNAKKTYKSASGDKLPKGNYYVSGVVIANNTVVGNCHGVKLFDVRNCKVTNNKLSFTGSIGKVNYYGITLKGNTKNITVSNNRISKHLNGIYLKEASAGNILNNTITNVKKYGISIEQSTANKISGNTVNKAKFNGIHLWDKSTVKIISNNKVSSVKVRGIYVGGKSKVTTINGNKFKACKEKINVNRDSSVKNKQ
jgi:parallel beta-helix repeat protein